MSAIFFVVYSYIATQVTINNMSEAPSCLLKSLCSSKAFCFSSLVSFALDPLQQSNAYVHTQNVSSRVALILKGVNSRHKIDVL